MNTIRPTMTPVPRPRPATPARQAAPAAAPVRPPVVKAAAVKPSTAQADSGLVKKIALTGAALGALGGGYLGFQVALIEMGSALGQFGALGLGIVGGALLLGSLFAGAGQGVKWLKDAIAK